MNKAKLHHLNFHVQEVPQWGGGKRPIINTDKDTLGSNLNGEMAYFIEGLGSVDAQDVINEINSLSGTSNGYRIERREVELLIFSSPPRAAFNNSNGGYKMLPLGHFLEILQEWIDFLNSLPFEHTLSDN